MLIVLRYRNQHHHTSLPLLPARLLLLLQLGNSSSLASSPAAACTVYGRPRKAVSDNCVAWPSCPEMQDGSRSSNGRGLLQLLLGEAGTAGTLKQLGSRYCRQLLLRLLNFCCWCFCRCSSWRCWLLLVPRPTTLPPPVADC